jgi:hypothetical protein
MNVELFVLCDAATEYQGKLNILGTFDAIWSKTVPFVHPLCAVALRLRFLENEAGTHKIKIKIIDEDRNQIIKPLETSGNVQFRESGLSTAAVNMILNLQGLKFPYFGEYSIDLEVDEGHESSLPLYINKVR